MILHTKFVIFVAVSAFLVAALYSSSAFIAFGTLSCRAAPGNSEDEICVSTDKKGKVKAVYYCVKEGEGTCIKVYSSGTGPTGDIQNETKVPKSDLLNDGGLLTEGSQSNNNTAECCCGDPGAPPCPKNPKDLGESNNDENGPAINPGLQ